MTSFRRQGAETRAALAPLASHPVGAPDPEFASSLEERLRLIHATRSANGSADRASLRGRAAGGPAPARLRWLVPVAVAAAGTVGLIVVSGSGDGSRPTGPTVEVARAIDAQTIGLGGHVVALQTGALLPDGTLIRTGPSGQVRADGGVLGPDSEAVVHGGHLTLLGHRPASARPAAPAGQRPVPSSSARPSGPTPVPAPPAPSSPPGQSAGHGHAATAPGHAGLHLSAHQARSGTEGLQWSRYDGPGLYGYVVLRSAPPEAPAYPEDAVHFAPAGSATSYTDSAGAAYYQVDAIDSAGTVLASSNVER